jgi:hypothetical protein
LEWKELQFEVWHHSFKKYCHYLLYLYIHRGIFLKYGLTFWSSERKQNFWFVEHEIIEINKTIRIRIHLILKWIFLKSQF